MRKIIFVGLICLLFTGCDFAVYNYQLNGYAEACAEKGGIARINNIAAMALCSNGEVVSWKSK